MCISTTKQSPLMPPIAILIVCVQKPVNHSYSDILLLISCCPKESQVTIWAELSQEYMQDSVGIRPEFAPDSAHIRNASSLYSAWIRQDQAIHVYWSFLLPNPLWTRRDQCEFIQYANSVQSGKLAYLVHNLPVNIHACSQQYRIDHNHV